MSTDRGVQIIANAVEANPNNQMVLIWAGIGNLLCGSLHESLAYSRRAILISPGDPTAHWPMSAIAHADLALGNFGEDALQAAERSLAINPDYPPTHWILIAAKRAPWPDGGSATPADKVPRNFAGHHYRQDP